MAAVKQEVLNWLYSILSSEYIDVNRTFNDVAQTLSRHPSLSPRTDVHTFDDGTSVLLLHLSGTIPVMFRGTVYRFPIELVVPHAYPREAPIAYVRPTENMVVRSGQHVDLQGKIYHPYLVAWAENWEKSNIVSFCEILRDIFSREPPVISRPQSITPPRPTSRPPSPPPRPGIQRPILQDPQQREQILPPRPAPKLTHYDHQASPAAPPRPETGPPLPPLPPLQRPPKDKNTFPGYQSQLTKISTALNTPQRSSSLRFVTETTPPVPSPQLALAQHLLESQGPLRSTSSPSFQYNPCNSEVLPGAFFNYTTHQIGALSLPQQNSYSHQELQHPPNSSQILPPPPPSPPKMKPPPPPDLLSTSLAAINIEFSTPTPPAIPSNPEKNLLLKNISRALYLQRQSIESKTNSSLVGLKAQKSAMYTSLSKMEAEAQMLGSLKGILSENTEILLNVMREADSVINSSQHRKVPNVDELLVAPTVVANQLYEVVSEERSLEDTLFILGRAVERGRISAAVFAKITRSLAREWYLKKALVRKIGDGLGLTKY